MMISDKIPKHKKTLEERGVPEGSSFFLIFKDKSSRTEKDTSWEDVSEEQYVEYMDQRKVVRVCKHPVSEITIAHDGIVETIKCEKDEQPYQFFKAETTFHPNGTSVTNVVGRGVGKVKNGKVVEEKLIFSPTHEVFGFKA